MGDWVLNAGDRCDMPACGARAYVLALVGASDIFFCAHHYSEAADGLFDIGAQIVDEREQLNVRVDASA
jgi:hypothetical protein